LECVTQYKTLTDRVYTGTGRDRNAVIRTELVDVSVHMVDPKACYISLATDTEYLLGCTQMHFDGFYVHCLWCAQWSYGNIPVSESARKPISRILLLNVLLLDEECPILVKKQC
jgi:hypothetical protein